MRYLKAFAMSLGSILVIILGFSAFAAVVLAPLILFGPLAFVIWLGILILLLFVIDGMRDFL